MHGMHRIRANSASSRRPVGHWPFGSSAGPSTHDGSKESAWRSVQGYTQPLRRSFVASSCQSCTSILSGASQICDA